MGWDNIEPHENSLHRLIEVFQSIWIGGFLKITSTWSSKVVFVILCIEALVCRIKDYQVSEGGRNHQPCMHTHVFVATRVHSYANVTIREETHTAGLLGILSYYCCGHLYVTSNRRCLLARRISGISQLSTSFNLQNLIDYLNSASICHVFPLLFNGL